MIKFKYYAIAVIDVMILQVHHLEWLDESVKRASLIVGLVVGVFTAIKFYQDIMKNHTERKIQLMKERMEEERIRRFFEQKHK
jgi:uncharacterized membrane protein